MELNEKLAKWAGFKLHYNDWDEERQFPYFIPSGKPWRTHKIDSRPVPNFPEDLNACFKWLVPKLIDKVETTYHRYRYTPTLQLHLVSRLWIQKDSTVTNRMA